MLGKIVVTGGTGFVGRHLLTQLIEQKRSVLAVHRSAVNSPVKGVQYQQYAGMTADVDWQTLLVGVETVIHCAARVHVMQETSSDPLAAFRSINVEGTMKMANQAVKSGVKRFIFLSSIGVLGAQTFDKAFNNRTQARPHSPYAQSKYEAEQALMELSAKSGMEVVIIRPPLIYGVNAPGNFDTLLKVVEKGIPLPFAADKNKRSFIAVDNLVDFICHCIDHKNAPKCPMVISDGPSYSTGQLIRAISHALNRKPLLFWFPSNVFKILLRCIGKGHLGQQLCGSLEIDASESMNNIDWQPPLSMSEALEKMVVHRKLLPINKGVGL